MIKKIFYKKNNIEVIDINYSYFKYLPKTGFLSSRISYVIISLLSIMPLIMFLKKKRPKFLIGHLITALPIVLFNIFNFDTKFILRISGYPKLNLFRKNLWKFLSKKIYNITCPSEDLKSQLIKDNIFLEKKLFFFLILLSILKKLKMILILLKSKKILMIKNTLLRLED